MKTKKGHSKVLGRNQHSVIQPHLRHSPPRKDVVFRRLEASVPREQMATILETSGDTRAAELCRLLLSPEPLNRRCSLPELARRAGMSYADVLRAVTVYRVDEGLLRMSAHVPEVLEDVAVDAKSKLVVCPECKGDGFRAKEVIPAPDHSEDGDGEDGAQDSLHDSVVAVPCFVCDGTGKLRKAGDTDARKLMFETLGLTNKSRGSFVNVNVGAAAIPSVEDEMTRATKILEAPRPELPPASAPAEPPTE